MISVCSTATISPGGCCPHSGQHRDWWRVPHSLQHTGVVGRRGSRLRRDLEVVGLDMFSPFIEG